MSNPAETYESFMVPPLFAPWAARLIEFAKPQPGERVLDVATGTGIVARRVAPLVEPSGHVIGLDLTSGMLAVARQAAEREGLNIEWREGQAEALPFPDGSFELVLCQFALMFFSDRQAALREMRRVLTSTGRLTVSVFQDLDWHPFYQRLDAVIQQRFGMSAVRDIFALGDRDVLSALLEDAGFLAIEIDPVTMNARFPDPDIFLAREITVDTAAIPAMQHLDTAAREEMVKAIAGDMAQALREVTEGDEVVLPFYAYIARANAGTTL